MLSAEFWTEGVRSAVVMGTAEVARGRLIRSQQLAAGKPSPWMRFSRSLDPKSVTRSTAIPRDFCY
jgi:hypothetical protein